MWVLFKGGMNLNSVPDLAEFTIDIRTIPGQDNETILSRVKVLSGDEATLKPGAQCARSVDRNRRALDSGDL